MLQNSSLARIAFLTARGICLQDTGTSNLGVRPAGRSEPIAERGPPVVLFDMASWTLDRANTKGNAQGLLRWAAQAEQDGEIRASIAQFPNARELADHLRDFLPESLHEFLASG